MLKNPANEVANLTGVGGVSTVTYPPELAKIKRILARFAGWLRDPNLTLPGNHYRVAHDTTLQTCEDSRRAPQPRGPGGASSALSLSGIS